MRKTILEITQSLTASSRTEMLCMKVCVEEDMIKYYFVEYPTNCPPNHNNLEVKGNHIVEVTEGDYVVLREAFEESIENMRTKQYIHSPTYILAFCTGRGMDLSKMDILN